MKDICNDLNWNDLITFLKDVLLPIGGFYVVLKTLLIQQKTLMIQREMQNASNKLLDLDYHYKKTEPLPEVKLNLYETRLGKNIGDPYGYTEISIELKCIVNNIHLIGININIDESDHAFTLKPAPYIDTERLLKPNETITLEGLFCYNDGEGIGSGNNEKLSALIEVFYKDTIGTQYSSKVEYSYKNKVVYYPQKEIKNI